MEQNEKDDLLDRLVSLTGSYIRNKKEFKSREAILKGQFSLEPEQEREVEFGIIIPADRSLQKYLDILNSDPKLNTLSKKILDIILKGCVEIFKELNLKKINIPGYDLDAFIHDPEDYADEILNLMQGFGGCKHIHTIKGKLALEIPAKRFIKKEKYLRHCIKFWLKTVSEFSIY